MISEQRFSLHPAIRLRAESFGGIAYHRGNGRLIELDAEGFYLMTLLGASDPLTIRQMVRSMCDSSYGAVPAALVAHLIAELSDRDFVVEGISTRNSTPVFSATSDGALSAPITVHWALTYACNYQCPHCYAPSPGTPGEMTLNEKLASIRRMSEWGVFEVALGGGEPTASRHLHDVLHAIRENGMVPNLTTNGSFVNQELAQLLAKTCGTVQISLDRPDILDLYRGEGASRRAILALGRLQGAGTQVGVNLLIVPQNIEKIDESLDWIVDQGVRRVVLLRPFGR